MTEKKIFQKEFGLFHSNQPLEFHQEAIAFRLHSFCYTFINKKFPNYQQSKHRSVIEPLIWNHYYQEANTLRVNRPEFNCLSSQSTNNEKIKISFQLDSDLGFLPYKWEKYNNNNLISIEIDEYKTGKPTNTVIYDPNRINCIMSRTMDTNKNGIPDIWFRFENCKLVSHQEDFNENGNFERECQYNSEGNVKTCVGIGERNLNLAKEFEAKEEWIQAIYHYNQLIDEYNQEFQGYSRHICMPQFKILQFQYNLMNYTSLNERYQSLKDNPYCQTEVKNSQIFIGFINLYSLKNWESGLEQLEAANKSYKEERGWDSIEINLALSYGYLNTMDYSACMNSLQKIAGRPFNRKGRYFYFYYFGSCKLGEKDTKAAIPALMIALDACTESDDRAIVLYKLGYAHLYGEDQSDRALSGKYFKQALQINPKLLPAIEFARSKQKEDKDFTRKP